MRGYLLSRDRARFLAIFLVLGRAGNGSSKPKMGAVYVRRISYPRLLGYAPGAIRTRYPSLRREGPIHNGRGMGLRGRGALPGSPSLCYATSLWRLLTALSASWTRCRMVCRSSWEKVRSSPLATSRNRSCRSSGIRAVIWTCFSSRGLPANLPPWKGLDDGLRAPL